MTARRNFLPGSPLMRSGLIQLTSDPNQVCTTLLDAYLKLEDRAVTHVLGDTSMAPQAKGLCTIVEPNEGVSLTDADLAGLLPMAIDARKYFRSLALYFQGGQGLGQREAANALASAIRAPLVVCDCSAAMAFAIGSGASANPMRQPVIAYALLTP